MSGPQADNAALRPGMVLQLSRRAREAGPGELPFIMANETRQLLPYRQAVFWEVKDGRTRLEAVSGLAAPDRNSPFAFWMKTFAARCLEAEFRPADPKSRARSLDLEDLAQKDEQLTGWRDWVPGRALACVLYGPPGSRDRLCGYLCLFRENEFNDSETALFEHLAEAYGYSLGALGRKPARSGKKRGFKRLAATAALFLLLLFLLVPRPQTILAQAEVTARQPALVRAGVDGVVEKFLVAPNQRVRPGEALFQLEDTQFRTRLAVAEKSGEMAQIELRQLQQSALHDPAAKARIPLAQARAEQLQAEADYVRSLLERVVAVSPSAGVALIDNPDEWQGRPVSLGQKIMMVADPDDVMLEIYLPAAEAPPVEPGDELLFFPNVAPASPLRDKVVYAGYRAMEVPGLGMAFPLRAEFTDADTPMLGLRGTARLSSTSSPLGVIILRKPIMAVRQWLGW